MLFHKLARLNILSSFEATVWTKNYTKTFSPILTSPYLHPRQGIHSSAGLQDTFKIQDEDDFETRVLKSKKPVIVQFHASWCGPCKVIGPRMEKSIALANDVVDLAQVDIDDTPDIAMSYSVGAVPAVMAVKDGKVIDKFVGLKDEDQIDVFIQNVVK